MTRSLPAVTALYTLIAIVMTWPVAARLGSAIAGDLGDPVLNCWILMWTSGQVLAALGGDWGALGRYWHGNVFHPERYTLAFSEHLTPQMLMALPVIAITDNVVLAYNLLFLSTFVLCGLGAYLLVHDLTGERGPAFVAGLAFAWAPYRIAQTPHLQVLTSFWMPFALVGFQRYFASRRLGPLAGGSAALALQNLSCGYFLLYFPPFVAAYGLYEIVRRRLARDWRVLAALAGAAAAVALVTWPFVAPYLAVRAGGEMGVRTPEEIRAYSADLWAFGHASPRLRLWNGRMSAFPKAEGEGFPGLTIAALAGLAAAVALTRSVRGMFSRTVPTAVRFMAVASAAALAASGGVALWILAASGLRLPLGGTLFIFYNPVPALAIAVPSAVVLVVSVAWGRGDRSAARRWPIAFFACAAVAAAVLAFGPIVTSAGRPFAPGPYALLQTYVPGFDGSRVPARFLMLVALFVAVLAGFGAALAARFVPARAAPALLTALGALVLAESWIAPVPMNVPMGVPAGLVSPASLAVGRDVSPIYGVIARLPGDVVLIEFPFGEPAHDVQAMYHAGRHRRPIVNGYSGYLPRSFSRRVGRLWYPPDDPVRAAGWLVDTAATHALVHEAAFADDRGRAVSEWLVGLGARPVTSDGPDKLFQLK
jgi:hypothetical protein